MKKPFALILTANDLTVAGSMNHPAGAHWEYKTISGKNDEILTAPAAQGWTPVNISVTPDGNRWFLLKRPKGEAPRDRWEYKTVSSSMGDEVLNTPMVQGWSVVGFSVTPDGNQWFLLKKRKE